MNFVVHVYGSPAQPRNKNAIVSIGITVIATILAGLYAYTAGLPALLSSDQEQNGTTAPGPAIATVVPGGQAEQPDAPQPSEQGSLLSFEAPVNGSLATGAYDEFTLQGQANVPLLLTIETPDGNLGFNAVISDRVKQTVANGGSFNGGLVLPFTPLEDSAYTLRIEGVQEYGSYTIRVEQLD